MKQQSSGAAAMSEDDVDGRRQEENRLLSLVDSENVVVADEATGAIREMLASSSCPSLVSTIVHSFMLTKSQRYLEILSAVKEPDDKCLFDCLTLCLECESATWDVCSVVIDIANKQPLWLPKIARFTFLTHLLRLIKTSIDHVVLVSGLMTCSALLPHVPILHQVLLNEFFLALIHVADILHSKRIAIDRLKKKKHGRVEFDYHESTICGHLHLAFDNYFHLLYGIYPCNLVGFLRNHFFNNPERRPVFDAVIRKSMSRLHLHPMLLTWTRETELSRERWTKREAHDVVAECLAVVCCGRKSSTNCRLLVKKDADQHLLAGQHGVDSVADSSSSGNWSHFSASVKPTPVKTPDYVDLEKSLTEAKLRVDVHHQHHRQFAPIFLPGSGDTSVAASGDPLYFDVAPSATGSQCLQVPHTNAASTGQQIWSPALTSGCTGLTTPPDSLRNTPTPMASKRNSSSSLGRINSFSGRRSATIVGAQPPDESTSGRRQSFGQSFLGMFRRRNNSIRQRRSGIYSMPSDEVGLAANNIAASPSFSTAAAYVGGDPGSIRNSSDVIAEVTSEEKPQISIENSEEGVESPEIGTDALTEEAADSQTLSAIPTERICSSGGGTASEDAEVAQITANSLHQTSSSHIQPDTKKTITVNDSFSNVDTLMTKVIGIQSQCNNGFTPSTVDTNAFAGVIGNEEPSSNSDFHPMWQRSMSVGARQRQQLQLKRPDKLAFTANAFPYLPAMSRLVVMDGSEDSGQSPLKASTTGHQFTDYDYSDMPVEDELLSAITAAATEIKELRDEYGIGDVGALELDDQSEHLQINILKTELRLVGTYLRYEKFRRALHAQRNRRLFGRLKQQSALEGENEQLKKCVCMQETEIQELIGTCAELGRSLRDKEAQLDKLTLDGQTAIDAKDKTIASLKKSLSTLQVETDKASKESRNMRREFGSVKQRLFDTECELKVLKGNYSRVTKQAIDFARLQRENHNYCSKLDQFNAMETELKLTHQESAALKQRIDQLHEAHCREVNELKRSMKSERLSVDRLGQNNAYLEVELKDAQAQIERLKAAIDCGQQTHSDHLDVLELKHRALVAICQRQEGHIVELYAKLSQRTHPTGPSDCRIDIPPRDDYCQEIKSRGSSLADTIVGGGEISTAPMVPDPSVMADVHQQMARLHYTDDDKDWLFDNTTRL